MELYTYEARIDEHHDWEWVMDSDERIENIADMTRLNLGPENEEIRRQPEDANGEPIAWEYFDLLDDQWRSADIGG